MFEVSNTGEKTVLCPEQRSPNEVVATLAAGGALWRLHRSGLTDDVPQWRRSKEILLGIVAAFTVAMLTLSRAYVATPYLALGLVTAYLGALANEEEVVPERFDSRFVKHLALASVAFVLFAYVFVRATAHWPSA